MKLRALATGSVVAAVLGSLALAGVGFGAWRQGQTALARIDQVVAFHHRAEKVGVAIDYITLLRADETVARAVAADAQQLAEALAALDHPGARLAREHLREIEHISREFAVVVATTNDDDSVDLHAPGVLSMVRQLRIHQSASLGALHDTLRQLNREIIVTLTGILGLFIVCTLAFAAVAVGAFGVLARRLGKPIGAIEAAIRAVEKGDLTARITLDGNDELSGLARLFNQMAERRQEDIAALVESEERFRQLADNIPEVLWMRDRESRQLLYISPSYETVWGRTCASLHRDSDEWLEAVHPQDRAHVEAALLGLAAQTYCAEYRIVRPDGSIRWIADRAFPVDDRRLVGIAHDFTERKQAQIALCERVKELRCLYRVLELTTDGQRTVEEACTEIVSVLPESLLHPEHAAARVVLDEGARAAHGWLEPMAATLRSDIPGAGAALGFVEVGYRALLPDAPRGEGPFLYEERELLDSVALHISRMLQSRKALAALARTERLSAVGQLTGGVAHDFNNLLTVVLGNAEVLARELPGHGPHRPLAEMIGKAAQRGADLVQRLLAFARQQALEPKAVDINRLVANMDGLLRHTLGAAVEIEFTRGGGLWTAHVDPSQLENALLNLCINARDAMPDGGRLTIETANAHLDRAYAEQQADVRPGQYVMIAVSDTGTGIAPTIRDRVFEPFVTTKEKGKGTGLGLSMVYGFVKQSGGHVRIYSESGEGTTVRLYLPRFRGEAQAAAAGGSTPIVGGSETILIVEDDDLVLAFAQAQVEALGYTVLTARSGREALEWLQRRDGIDLLFTDVVMPGGMSGRALASAATQHHPGLKVLYTSGYTENAIVHHGRLDEGVELLGKPYQRSELARRIREVLDAKQD